MSLFLLIIIYKLLIDVREVKTRFKLIKHIDTEKVMLRSVERTAVDFVADIPTNISFSWSAEYTTCV
jgi:hypothetical protein